MASTIITRTPASNGNQKVWTWSGWIKNNGKSGDSTYQYFMEANYGNNHRYSYICLRHGTIETYGGDYTTSSSSMSFDVTTNRLLRDPSAWFHVVVAFDSTQSTSTDRLKIYINGVQETSFQGYVGSGASATFPAQDDVTFFNVTTTQNKIGRNFDGSMAHVHFVDGTAYTPSTFGETDSVSGIWKPKASPTGISYGTNGFFLKFENSGNMDLDSSTNAHTFATSGTLTQNVDTPSNNFATMNPLDNYYPSSSFSNGNNTVVTTSGNYSYNTATIGVNSGKYYWEVKAGSSNAVYMLIGIASQLSTSNTNFLGNSNYQYAYYGNGGQYYNNNSQTGYGNAYTANDIIGVAMDLDNNKLYFSKNGTWQNSGDPTSGSTGTGAISIADPSLTQLNNYFPAVSEYDNTGSYTYHTNFGNGYFGTTQVASAGTAPSGGGIFEYDCPSGYQALCTKGINSF